MLGLILAAGLGSRLRAVSPSKPLTAVGGIPLIEHVIACAAESGVRHFRVVTGHEADLLEAFLAGLGPRLGVDVEWVRAKDWQRPNGYSVLDGAAGLDDEFLLLMADHLFDPAILRRLLALRGSGAGLTLAVDEDVANPALDLDDATKVAVGTDGFIQRIGKGLERYNAIDTGLFLATPALADAIREDVVAGGGGSLSGGVQRLADRRRARVMAIGKARWLDVDTPADLEQAEAFVASIRDSAA
ncbi:MAG: phosphocholine cytidylyltransferase family protein [Sphingosinicella sp.]